MKKQNVRKEALKITAVFMAICIVIELLLIALVLLLSKGGIILMEINAKTLIIAMVVIDVPLTFLAYSDFKKEVVSWKEEQNK